MLDQQQSFRFKYNDLFNEDTDDFIISPWIETDYDSERYQNFLAQKKNIYKNLTKLKPIDQSQKIKENQGNRCGIVNSNNSYPQRYQFSIRTNDKQYKHKEQNIKNNSYQSTKRNTKTNLQLSPQFNKPLRHKKLNSTYRNFKGSNFKLEFRNIQGLPLHAKIDPNKTTADLNKFINLGLKNTMLKQIFYKNIQEKKLKDCQTKTEDTRYSSNISKEGQTFYHFQSTFSPNLKQNYAPSRKAIYSDAISKQLLDNTEKKMQANFSKTRQDIFKNFSIYSKSVTQIPD